MALKQREMVLDHLTKFRGITDAQAYSKYGIRDLASRIRDLRKRGYDIKSIWCSQPNRWGKKVRFVEYRLVKNEQPAKG